MPGGCTKEYNCRLFVSWRGTSETDVEFEVMLADVADGEQVYGAFGISEDTQVRRRGVRVRPPPIL